MSDRPTKLELLAAVRAFIDRELLPELEGVRRFHARVASNVLGIVSREIELEGPALRARYARLAELLGSESSPASELGALDRQLEELERELVQRIRAGDADASPWRADLLAHLRESVRERLAICNPEYR